MTGTLSRKQREIAAREQVFVDVGRRLLLERGYHGLTMDRVAAETEYSKGTVYHHFASKEDLIVEVLVRIGEVRGALFERAATFRGSTRERMHAIGVAAEIMPLLHPDQEICERLVRAESIRQKAAEDRVERLQAADRHVLGICFGLTRDGVAHGDLVLPDGVRLEDLTLGLWSLFQGAFSIIATDIPLAQLGFGDPVDVLQRNASLLLDGWGWQPLSGAFDASALRRRILDDVFPEEASRLGL